MIERLRTVAELIGILAVVLSLLLVVYELRQTQASISAAASSERADRLISLYQYNADHAFGEIREKQRKGEPLSPSELSAVRNSFRAAMRHFEDLHYQHQIGVTDEETWRANLAGLRFVVGAPEFGTVWPEEKLQFRASFVLLVESAAGT